MRVCRDQCSSPSPPPSWCSLTTAGHWCLVRHTASLLLRWTGSMPMTGVLWRRWTGSCPSCLTTRSTSGRSQTNNTKRGYMVQNTHAQHAIARVSSSVASWTSRLVRISYVITPVHYNTVSRLIFLWRLLSGIYMHETYSLINPVIARDASAHVNYHMGLFQVPTLPSQIPKIQNYINKNRLQSVVKTCVNLSIFICEK